MDPITSMESAAPQRRPHSMADPAERRNEIIVTARTLYEDKGMAKTSIQDITATMGVARSLFYHYFADKDAVTSAVLDTYVADYLEALHYWNANRRVGDIDHALTSLVRLLRVALFEHNAFREAIASQENAALYLDFINRIADKTAEYFLQSTVRDYESRHEVHIEHRYETFYMLILGVIGYLRTHPTVDDQVIVDLIAQTLHMDRPTTSTQETD